MIAPESPIDRRRLRRRRRRRPRPTATATATASLNRVDLDDDNDLLTDGLEVGAQADPCVGDTDGDGVEDGYEYQSAVDLNNDDYQQPNVAIPYPGKRPYPNPLFKDADLDYDGDALTLRRRVRAVEVHVRGQPHAPPARCRR